MDICIIPRFRLFWLVLLCAFAREAFAEMFLVNLGKYLCLELPGPMMHKGSFNLVRKLPILVISNSGTWQVQLLQVLGGIWSCHSVDCSHANSCEGTPHTDLIDSTLVTNKNEHHFMHLLTICAFAFQIVHTLTQEKCQVLPFLL